MSEQIPYEEASEAGAPEASSGAELPSGAAPAAPEGAPLPAAATPASAPPSPPERPRSRALAAYGGLLRATHALGVAALLGTCLLALGKRAAAGLSPVVAGALSLWALTSTLATLALPLVVLTPTPQEPDELARQLGFATTLRLRLSLAGAPLGFGLLVLMLLVERLLAP